jgi:transposase
MNEQRKKYRRWDAQTGRGQAVSPNDVLPDDDLVFFVLDLIPTLNLDPIHQHYASEARGQPPFDVTMMVALLTYAYAIGVTGSRKIARACETNLAFRAIVADDPPDFRTLSDFRKLHRATFKGLFLEVLRVAGEMGLVKLGNLSTDGTKMKANASRHKAMSYGYMKKEEERLQAEVEQLLKQAEQTDAEQDAALGSRRGDELPAELKRRGERLAKIREAKARLEAAAQARADEEQRERDAARAQREAEGRPRRGKEPAPIDPTPADQAQTNFTDPDAKIMLQNHKGFDYSYNAQATVDGHAQIIVAAELTTAANDKQQAIPLGQATLANLAAAGIARPTTVEGTLAPLVNTLDNGYFSAEVVDELTQLGFDPHIATGRPKHHETPASPVAGFVPPDLSPNEQMAHKLRTPVGKALYAARKHIVEPVFGQIKGVRGIRRLMLRGFGKVAAEWQLICLTHNLLKLWRHRSVPA